MRMILLVKILKRLPSSLTPWHQAGLHNTRIANSTPLSTLCSLHQCLHQCAPMYTNVHFSATMYTSVHQCLHQCCCKITPRAGTKILPNLAFFALNYIALKSSLTKATKTRWGRSPGPKGECQPAKKVLFCMIFAIICLSQCDVRTSSLCWWRSPKPQLMSSL